MPKVKVETLFHYRFNSRAKSYTKAWWEQNIEPLLLGAGLTERARYTGSATVFHEGELTEQEALALRTSLDKYRKKVSFGIRFNK
jgi:hypothetical protein